ncbi:MFS transporter, DHA2 family, multidrug resistance protein [Rhizobiales bacterium GAS188]|nr:MFS transporter, DHA2 family, multidrug resistance protein [Rhizobiales bacterium GAS188]
MPTVLATPEIGSTKRALLTVCVMMATIMQALDTTIANVALPYMQGSLGTTQDQVSWVLTSYIVAAAIMTAPLGWMSTRFGRKKLFLVCVVGFTVASMLCGIAQNIEQMVLFRLLQGVFGAALVPLSQSVLLDIYPVEQRGQAMALWGMGVMLGPIMGPTLGGWLTDSFDWRWVFFVNLPFGILTTLGIMFVMDEARSRRDIPFDWFGFLSLSLGIGAMQMLLDRGQDQGWFESNEIWTELFLSIAGFYFFFAHALTAERSFIPLSIFKDRNFAVSVAMMFLVGIILLATIALITPYIQNLMGYPVLTSGFLLGGRGIGTFFAMMLVGRLLKYIDARHLVFVGLIASTFSLNQMVYFTPDVAASTILWNSVVQGLGLGFIFVPLNTIAFSTLPLQFRTDATALWTLIRNLGSSVGVSIVFAELTTKTTMFHSQLVEFVTPFNNALQNPDVARILSMTSDTGRAMLDQLVTKQAEVMAYSNDFRLMTFVSLAAFPLLFLLRSTRRKPVSSEAVHAME